MTRYGSCTWWHGIRFFPPLNEKKNRDYLADAIVAQIDLLQGAAAIQQLGQCARLTMSLL